MADRRDQSLLIPEFRRALHECEQLYRRCAHLCAWDHPELIRQPPEEFLALMRDLHRALVIKVFVDVSQIDWHWSREERLLAAELVDHVWGHRMEGDSLEQALGHIVDQAQIRWESVVRPFAQMAPLQAYAGDLETLILRLANIVAKADGKVLPQEIRQLEWIENEARRHLHRLPLDEPGQHEAAQTAGTSAVRKMHSEAEEIRSRCRLEAEPERAQPAPAGEPQLDQALEELNKLIGLSTIKNEIHSLVNFLKVQEQRKRVGLPETPVTLHMVFLGNPGTGKTTVGRILGHIFAGMGILAKGHLIETDRSGLVAEYAGQTGPKTNRKIDEALDGVLFVDEAYSLVAQHGDDPYGHEAVQTLLKRMEDDRQRLIVILAGYPEPVDHLLHSNPGLLSRFPRRFEFPDYTAAQLGSIFQLMCAKNHYKLPALARVKLLLGLQYLLDRRDEHFGNGRLARNVFEQAIRRLANRIAGIAPLTRKLLTTLEPDDLFLPGVADEAWQPLDRAERRFQITCPGCEHTSKMRQSLLGRRVQCKRCEHRFRADWGDPIIEP